MVIMYLNEQTKKVIDSKSYSELLEDYILLGPDDPWLEGETGIYWKKRIVELRKDPAPWYTKIDAKKVIRYTIYAILTPLLSPIILLMIMIHTVMWAFAENDKSWWEFINEPF